VEGLRHEHGIGARVGQRNALGGSLERLGGGHRPSEVVPHFIERLDRDHARKERRQGGGQLAGAGAEIDDN
jgi:hypothetical protein